MASTVAGRLAVAPIRSRRGAHRAPPPRRRSVRPTPGGVAGATLIALLLIAALSGPWLVTADPADQSLRDRLQAPVFAGGRWAHPLGTDHLGRDLLARVVAGARTSLVIGIVATTIAGVAGVTLGLIGGYAGGRVDRFVTFLSDVQLALPFVVVGSGVVAVLGNSLRNVILVLAITGWVGYARVIRIQAMALRSAPFVDAARAMGASRARILMRHVLPNTTGSIVVLAGQQIAAMVLFEAALSYLGLGVPGETITWGGMVAEGQETLLTAWWVAAVPGTAIALTILGLNLFGDWLRGALDPTASNNG